VCLILPLGTGTAAAHDDDRGDRDALDVEVLAAGLDGPRGLTLDRHENVWFAQAGRGGEGPCFGGAEGATCLGDTGKVSVLREDDHKEGRRARDDDSWSVADVVAGLPSLGLQDSGENAIGPSDVAFDRNGRLLATMGLGADPAVRTDELGGSELARTLGTVQRIDTRRGTARVFADVGRYESENNPEPEDLDSNPTSIAVKGNQRLVADAGGNSLLRVRDDGDVETVFVFPKEAPVQNPFAPPGVMIEADAVPSAVVRGPDGAFYVGQLTGFPFTPGTATVWRFAQGKKPTVYADGFTTIIDLAFDDDGNLLVLEFAHNGLLSGDPTGGLVQVSRRNPAAHTLLLTDPLVSPGGIVVDDDDAYISNHSAVPGEGEILHVDLDD